MRFGFAPIRGSNPRASAPDQLLRTSGAVATCFSDMILLLRWHDAVRMPPGECVVKQLVHHRGVDVGRERHRARLLRASPAGPVNTVELGRRLPPRWP